MRDIVKKELEGSIGDVPAGVGLFLLKDAHDVLFAKSSENLQRFISLYCMTGHENKNMQELSNSTQTISFATHSSLIEAFVEELFYIHAHQPEYNNIIKPWYDYVYLGISFKEPPYIKVCSDTLDDRYFIGPFRSVFALNDVLDTFASIFKLPHCSETEDSHPCERLKDGLCLGFCNNKLEEALPEMLNRLMMVPNKEAILKLEQNYQTLKDALQFHEADALETQIDLLKRYYKNLLFSYTSQYISGEFKINNATLFIKQGMIQEIVAADRFLQLPQVDISYRKPNELLAYAKHEYDHRWIVFSFIYNTMPDYLETLFLENVVDLQKEIFSNLKNEGV